METNRQKKIAGIIQEDLADILLKELKKSPLKGVLLSVTEVSVPTDLSSAKIYLSIFPKEYEQKLIQEIIGQTPRFRHELSQRTRHQLRRVPELVFILDHSVERAEALDRSFKGTDNPIETPDLLAKRKKL